MAPYWIEWWCRLFGYGSCRSIPAVEALIFWGGTALGVIGLAMVVINWMINKTG